MADKTSFVGDPGDIFFGKDELGALRISDGVTPGGVVIGDASLPFTYSGNILTLDANHHLRPAVSGEQDLGHSTKKWRDLYLSGTTIYLGGLTLKEDTSGRFEIPAGTVMRNADGTGVEPVATVDLDSIDWSTVLAGIDLGLEYATTSYVDGKFDELGDVPAQLGDLSNVTSGDAANNAVLMYSAANGLWIHNNDLVSDVETIQSDIEQLQEDVVNLNSSVTTNTTNIASNATNITTLNSLTLEHTTRIDAAETTIEDNSTNITRIDTAVSNNTTNITNMTTTLNTAVSNITNLTATQTTLVENNTTNQTNITNLQGDVTTINNSITTINNDILTIEGDITTIEGDITTIEGNVTTLTADLSALTIRVSANETDIETLENSVTSNTSDIAVLETTTATNTANIATANTAITDLNTKHSAQADLIQDNADAIAGLTTSVGTITTTQTSQDVRITRLEADMPERLTELGIADGTNGQVLTTDGQGNFSFATLATGSGGGGQTLSINDLNDVDTDVTLTTGMYLKWNGSEWAPSAIVSSDVSGGGGGESSNGLKFSGSGTSRVGTIFNEDGVEYTIREAFINTDDLLELEIASFTPNCSASQTNLQWDEVATQFSVTIDNPDDFTSNYVAEVYSLSNQVGFVLANGTPANTNAYFSSGPSVTPAGGVDWTQTFTNQADGFIRSSSTTLSGGSASATINFVDANDDLITFTNPVVARANWANANASISMQSAPNTLFLSTITSVGYNVNIAGIANSSNYSATVTPTGGTVTNASGSGTFNFTTPLHKDNNTGRTLALSVDFTRPQGVTGTSYTVTDTDTSQTTISTTWQYPSFYYFSDSVTDVPTRTDIVDGNVFHSDVTTTAHHGRSINTTITNSANVPKVFWFGVSSFATQPSTFETGATSSLLSSVSTTTATVSLAPDNAPLDYSAVTYNLYGIVLQPGSTYVRIS